jgi:hypothetical protein
MKFADGRIATRADELADRFLPEQDRQLTSCWVEGPEALAARLQEAGITIARVTSADVQALDVLRQEAALAANVAWTKAETNRDPSARFFADLQAGDLAAVMRSGDVFRVSPDKIAGAADHLPAPLPSVVEARAAWEIVREGTAAALDQRRDEGMQAYADYVENRDATRADQASSNATARQASDLAAAADATLDHGQRFASGLAAHFAKAVENALGGLFSFFFAAVKDTPQQAELKARAAEERAVAQEIARDAQQTEAATDRVIEELRRQQEAQAEQDPRMAALMNLPVQSPRLRQEKDRDREAEREY